MEDWAARGIPSSYDATQMQAVVGLLQRASTAIRSSRRRLDHVGTRLFALLPHARAALAQGRADRSRETVEGFLEEIDALGTEASAILSGVAVAARSLSDASSVVRPPLRKSHSQGVQTPRLDSTTRLTASSPRPERSETLDEITRRDDVKYRG